MNKLICVFILAIVAINAMNQNIAFLEQLKKSDFGKTILQTMQIQFQTSDGIDEVMNLLQRLQDGITREAATDKAEHARRSTDLTIQIRGLQAEIATARRQVTADTRTLRTRSQ
jgi:hypothetical protein